MLFLSVGLPGRFAEWCDAAIARVVGISGETVELRAWPPLVHMFGYGGVCSTLDEIGRGLLGCAADHLVIGARQPDSELCGHLARLNARLVVALEDPRIALAAVVRQPDVDPTGALRAVANSCPLLIQYTALASALTLRAEAAVADPVAAVLAIAQHIGISIDSAAAGAIADALGEPTWLDESSELNAMLPATAGKLLDGLLLPYSRWFAGGRLQQFTWTRELFHVGVENPGGPAQPLNVEGGSRILIYGPYIQLPAGSWTAQVVLGFSPEAAGFTYLVDAFADERLAATTFQPSRPGIYTAELTFSLGQPGGKGVEIRVLVMSDDARGQLGLGHVVLNPVLTQLSSADSLAGGDFAAVLDL